MKTIAVKTFDDWRTVARQMIIAGVPPEAVCFHDQSSQLSLFDEIELRETTKTTSNKEMLFRIPRVPPAFIELARSVACYRDSGRFQLLYRTLWRLTRTEPDLLEMRSDDDLQRLRQMQRAVRR